RPGVRAGVACAARGAEGRSAIALLDLLRRDLVGRKLAHDAPLDSGALVAEGWLAEDVHIQPTAGLTDQVTPLADDLGGFLDGALPFHTRDAHGVSVAAGPD